MIYISVISLFTLLLLHTVKNVWYFTKRLIYECKQKWQYGHEKVEFQYTYCNFEKYLPFTLKVLQYHFTITVL